LNGFFLLISLKFLTIVGSDRYSTCLVERLYPNTSYFQHMHSLWILRNSGRCLLEQLITIGKIVSIDNNKTRDSTSISLFAQEMKYLHDNGFRVLTVKDLGYDTKNNFFKPSVAE
jgi:hypothetical protein